MIRVIIGIGLGVVLTAWWPDIIPVVKSAFLDSGARDIVVDQLKEIK
jgi:hypothetical protein